MEGNRKSQVDSLCTGCPHVAFSFNSLGTKKQMTKFKSAKF